MPSMETRRNPQHEYAKVDSLEIQAPQIDLLVPKEEPSLSKEQTADFGENYDPRTIMQ